MLALLLRGFFLLTVMGWYSSSVWKMIDGYFKGQFQRYLDEEFQRNPKMREDVRRYGATDKSASPVTEELQLALQACRDGLGEEAVCAVGEAGTARIEKSGPSPPADAFAAGAAAGIAVEKEEEKAIRAEPEKEVASLENVRNKQAYRERPELLLPLRDVGPLGREAEIPGDSIE